MANVVRVDCLDESIDPRLRAYSDLKERELARLPGGLFIAEGEQLVRRLLASELEIDSILLSDRRAVEMLPAIADRAPKSMPTVFVAPDVIVNQLLGYKFHSGVMAAGCRPREMRLSEIVAKKSCDSILLVVCPEIANTENLGGMIRIAAAFGADAMILGERSCDPFFRQSVRVSMGAVFTLPIVRSDDLQRDLKFLKNEKIELTATVLDERAEKLGDFRRSKRCAILFGNEAQGLTPAQIAMCDRRITIPMKLGTDSLNVAIAAGIFLYQLTRPNSFEAPT